MEKQTYVISRSMFCKSCYGNRKPFKGDIFVIYRGDHGIFSVRKNHIVAIAGFTPHFISWEGVPEIVNGVVTLRKCCAVNHCGIFVNEKQYNRAGVNEEVDIKFNNWEDLLLPWSEFQALIEQWRGATGYNLF